MAVQAQYPSSILLADLRKRLSSEMCGINSGDLNPELNSHHQHHPPHNFYGGSTGTGASNLHQTTPINLSCNVNGAVDNGSNLLMPRKKLRSSDQSFIEASLLPPILNNSNNNFNSSSMQNLALLINSNNSSNNNNSNSNIPSHHFEAFTNSSDLINNCQNGLTVPNTIASSNICYNNSNSNNINGQISIGPRLNVNGFANPLAWPQQITGAVSSISNANDGYIKADKSSSVAFNNSSLSYSSGAPLQYISRQKEDIDEIINLHGEQMKKALEGKMQCHSRALIILMEKCMESSMREKDIEIMKAKRRYQELEQRVKEISLESHLWQNAAHNNEAMVNSLRSNLEQILAQSRDQQISNIGSNNNINYNMEEGCGETGGDPQMIAEGFRDAESCVNGEMAGRRKDCVDHGCGDGEGHQHVMRNSLHRELTTVVERHQCRFCKKNEVCVLLLPCRHLCLCEQCDAQFAHTCPICGCVKSASMRVFME